MLYLPCGVVERKEESRKLLKNVSTGFERVNRASRANEVGSKTTRLGGGRYEVITANSIKSRLGKFLAFFFWACSLYKLGFSELWTLDYQHLIE